MTRGETRNPNPEGKIKGIWRNLEKVVIPREQNQQVVSPIARVEAFITLLQQVDTYVSYFSLF